MNEPVDAAFMRGLCQERDLLRALGPLHAQCQFPVSMIFIVALVLLLCPGVLAIMSMTFNVVPLD